MTSSDLREVLNLPEGAAGARGSKKQKAPVPRPNLKGLAREVHNLGGDNPIAIVPDTTTSIKKRRWSSRKPAARWELRLFRNSGRKDGTLVLRHWRRAETKPDGGGGEEHQDKQQQQQTQQPQQQQQRQQEQRQEKQQQQQQQQQQEEQAGGSAEASSQKIEDSAFAKYSVQVSVPLYSDEQYQQLLKNSDWTKEETAYLMETVQDFDLRWPLIWDRYDWNPPATNGTANADGDEGKAVVHQARSRTMEELKARYYEIAATMMVALKPISNMSQAEYELHKTMANFNPQQEKARKDFALNTMSRSREEMREEESLLLEIKRILAKNERFNEERRELYNRLDYPQAEQDISSFKTSTGLQTLLQNLMAVDKSKKRKSVAGADGVAAGGASGPQNAAAESGKRDGAAAANHRESAAGGVAASSASKRSSQDKQQGQQPLQERRKLSAHEEAIYGVTHHERLGSGPTFRTEKINKLFSHKSNQQQIRINNMLNELDVPLKLAMATSVTTAQYELLVTAVISLLEARKTSDKLDAEIKVEQAKKAELDKHRAMTAGAGAEHRDSDAVKAVKSDVSDSNSKATASSTALPGSTTKSETNGGQESQQSQQSDDQEEKTPSAAVKDKHGDGEKSEGALRKRSASELSAMSDKTTKRQKK